MRELHVVALSDDGRSVLLATSRDARTGGFRVKIDDRLAAALRGELARPGEAAVRDTSVSPKEIQYRMRAGESAEQIAAAAGVPVARVERFAGPVLAERERIIDQARAASLSRGRLGPSRLSLGDAVAAALASTPSLRADSVTWAARRLDSGHWLVQLSYVARARARAASWVLDPSTRSLAATDPASAALGHAGDEAAGRSARRATPAPPVAERRAASPDPARRNPPGRRAARDTGADSVRAKKAAAKAVPATEVAAVSRATATKVAAKRVAAKRVAAKDAAATKVAASRVTQPVAQKVRPVTTKKLAVAPPPTARSTAAARPARKVAASKARVAEVPAAKLPVAPGAAKAPTRTAAHATAAKSAARSATKTGARQPAPAKQPPARPPRRGEAAVPARAMTAVTRPARTAPAPAVHGKPAARLPAAPLLPTGQAFPSTPAPTRITQLPESPPNLRVVPAPPAEQPPARRAAGADSPAPDAPAREAGPQALPVRKKRAAGERATVPDWADVLFGTAPRRDRTDD